VIVWVLVLHLHFNNVNAVWDYTSKHACEVARKEFTARYGEYVPDMSACTPIVIASSTDKKS